MSVLGLMRSTKRILVMPLNALGMRAENLSFPSPVVLLVHGFWNNRGVWGDLVEMLEERGISYSTVTLSPIGESMDFFAELVLERISSIFEKTRGCRILLVGHSMGGLVLRKAMSARGVDGLIGLVTLGTPHKGTSLAYVGLGKCAKEMEPGSAWLAKLRKPPRGFPVYAISAAEDMIVRPLSSSEPRWAVVSRLSGIGHNELVADERVFELIVRLVESES